ncbi:hypothetical protein EMEDMD4_310139 [Sinorhizobium medicae]|uniref:Uncharacterized protein n=1 Tax=Sinorhizobium medicae TaxID=110321 RepID=A0A508WYS6_9HYPH|nr:hypothetical protein EMEDMD4_310139 [Sinorhizobium medicae]
MNGSRLHCRLSGDATIGSKQSRNDTLTLAGRAPRPVGFLRRCGVTLLHAPPDCIRTRTGPATG